MAGTPDATSPTPDAKPGPGAPRTLSPWAFIPLLYFMQAIPVTIVQEVATVVYKDLGVANEPIVRWTSLISLPWSMQLLLGPLVDLTGTKRRWILGGQAVIAAGLIATAFLLQVPNFFEVTLLILGATAITSALTNIATDGFYILSMPEDRRAKFVGVQTTCYRLGRLFCTGGLLWIVGGLTKLPTLPVEVQGGNLAILGDPVPTTSNRFDLFIERGRLVLAPDPAIRPSELLGSFLGVTFQRQSGDPKDQSIYFEGLGLRVISSPAPRIPAGEFKLDGLYSRLSIDDTGTITAERSFSLLFRGRDTSTMVIGNLLPSDDVPLRINPATTPPSLPANLAWFLTLSLAAAIYLLGRLANSRTVPKPEFDRPSSAPDSSGDSFRANLARTLSIVFTAVTGYFALSAIVRLTAHGLWASLDGSVPVAPAEGAARSFERLQGWMLQGQASYVGFATPLNAVQGELAQLAVCGAMAALGAAAVRRAVGGTPMAAAFTSFVTQPRVGAILFFIFFYRFAEAMVGKISPLFLKDGLAAGGMAIPNDQLGVIKGFAGVIGIILGGLAGGVFVGKVGLRRAFWPLAAAMHIPNLMYVWAASTIPPVAALFLIEFVDQFGYGFGFAGYMIYLMYVAQRGEFKTAHYAIGTGLGALTIMTAGILSGILQANLGYLGFFVAVIAFAIPGTIAILMVPLDTGAGRAVRVDVD